MVTRIPARMIETTGVTAGSYSAADITVNSAGQVTSASTSSVASSGGGPKITSIVVTDSSYTNTDDTAVGLSGGYIKVTGTGFSTGCSIIIGTTVATSVSFINSTEVRAQVPAQSAGTYTVYLVNSDGGVGIRVNGLNYSSTPTWTTTSPLGDGSIDSAVSIQLAATSNSTVTYALEAGSTLPAGLSLSSSGLLTGTVTGITVDTTYNFTVVATDLENQDTPQAFSITITVSDPYFKNTVLLLQADTAPTVISDASTNNFDLSVAGDARASNFTPYGGAWSNYFNASSKLTFSSAVMALGTGPFTLEFWAYQLGAYSYVFSQTQSGTNYFVINLDTNGLYLTATTSGGGTAVGGGSAPYNQWHHCAIVREGTGTNQTKIYLNGVVVGTTTNSMDFNSGWTPTIGSYTHVGNPYTFYGYLSNFRIVKSAVYTSAFTPPTQNLTAIANTTILTCADNRFLDKSTNAYSITVTSATVTSFNPFNITNTGVNGSAYFDGTGDYLNIANNSALGISSGNFTIEFWINFNSVSSYPVLFDFRSAQPQAAPTIYLNNDSRFNYLFNSGTPVAFGPNPLIVGTWYHFAWVRSGTTHTIYVNGQNQATFSDAAGVASSALNIAARQAVSVQDYFNGYISDFRFVKGTAVYTANFTPPTQPLTNIANTSLLTLQYKQPHNNHSFQDSSSNNHLITRSGNTTQGTFSPFSQTGWGNYFDGSGDYLTWPPGSSVAFGTGDFTIEFWIYLQNDDSTAVILLDARNASQTTNWRLARDASTNKINFNNGSTALLSNDVLLKNTGWRHIAVTRSGTNLQIFLDGVQTGTSTDNTNYNVSPTISYIGCIYTLGGFLLGYISNLRIIKGTALYTANFTPSTSPLTAITNTSLLTCQSNRFIDNSSNNFTITKNGDTRVVAFSPFNPTASWSAATYGGSGYFDGSGDYLVVGSAADWAFLSNTTALWSIEMWVYHNNTSTSAIYFDTASGGSANVGITISRGSSNLVAVNIYRGVSGSPVINASSTTQIIPNAWNHVLITYDQSLASQNAKIYINGGSAETGNKTANTPSSSNPNRALTIGTFGAGLGEYFFGNIGSLRISNVIRSSGVPTTPYTSDANTKLLLNFTNAGIYDATSKNDLETVGDAQISNTTAQFGSTSIKFDGTGSPPDYLPVIPPVSDFYAFGTGDFTFELWLYTTTVSPAYQAVWDARTADPSLGSHFVLNSGKPTWWLNGASRIQGASALSINTWYHIAVARSGTSTKMFVDGTQVGSTYTDSNTYISRTVPRIGASFDTTPVNPFYGYIQDLRITKGYARYTQNFTPPAAKFLAR